MDEHDVLEEVASQYDSLSPFEMTYKLASRLIQARARIVELEAERDAARAWAKAWKVKAKLWREWAHIQQDLGRKMTNRLVTEYDARVASEARIAELEAERDALREGLLELYQARSAMALEFARNKARALLEKEAK